MKPFVILLALSTPASAMNYIHGDCQTVDNVIKCPIIDPSHTGPEVKPPSHPQAMIPMAPPPPHETPNNAMPPPPPASYGSPKEEYARMPREMFFSFGGIQIHVRIR